MFNRFLSVCARSRPRTLMFSFAAALAVAAGTSDAASRYSPPPPPAVPFQSYVVSVKSMQLVSTLGKKVEILSAPLPVDFAQVVDLEDAVYAGLVPEGDYVSARLLVDYSQAKITADDGAGHAVALRPIDANGAALTGTAPLTLKLDRYRHFVVSRQSAALYSLDVDLPYTNKADLANGLVYVGPTLVADVVASGSTWVKVNGTLVSTATDAAVLAVTSTKVINAPVGTAVGVELSPTTKYTIQGSAYTGDAGQAVFAALPKGTKLAVTGSLHKDRKTLAATSVVASP